MSNGSEVLIYLSFLLCLRNVSYEIYMPSLQSYYYSQQIFGEQTSRILEKSPQGFISSVKKKPAGLYFQCILIQAFVVSEANRKLIILEFHHIVDLRKLWYILSYLTILAFVVSEAILIILEFLQIDRDHPYIMSAHFFWTHPVPFMT